MNEKEAVQEVFADLAPRYEEVLDDDDLMKMEI